MWCLLQLLAGTAAADPGYPPQSTDRVLVEIAVDGAGWVEGEWVAVALPGAVPCPTAEGAACPGVALPLGQPLIVAARVAEELGDGRQRRRYALRAAGPLPPDGGPAQPLGPVLGFLPPEALTRAAWQVDLDQDGDDEWVTGHMDSAHHLWVFVRDGKRGAPLALDLGTHSDIDGVMTRATVGLVTAAEAGLPLVKVNWPANEMCGSGDHSRYASYRRPQGGGPGRLQLALEHGGSGGDAPIWWDTEVVFQPERGTVAVRATAGEYSDNGAADSIHSDETTRYLLVDGRFVVLPPSP